MTASREASYRILQKESEDYQNQSKSFYYSFNNQKHFNIVTSELQLLQEANQALEARNKHLLHEYDEVIQS